MLRMFKLKAGLALIAALLAVAVIGPGTASAECTTGGMSPAEIDVCTPTAKAKLLTSGIVIPPVSAPGRVKRVIAAANLITRKPYIYGGGHARWWDRGYDCSGSVSFALHGGKFLESPLPSTSMESWGLAGPGRWITVYANAGHVWMTVAGWRFDTVALAQSGTRWAQGGGEFSGFVVRHPTGL